MIDWHTINERPTNTKARYLVAVKIGKHYVYDLANYTNDLYNFSPYNFEKDSGAGFYRYNSEWGYVRTRDVVLWSELPEIPDCFEPIE